MTIRSLLFIILACALSKPAEPVLCAIFKENIDADNFACRNRPDLNLLGGPGCRISCLAKNSTCTELGDEGEVCGKLRIRVGFYALGKAVYQFCLIPDGGFLTGYFGRYCLSVRYCALRRRACGCRIVADGRPCRCRIEINNGNPEVVGNCPFVDQDNTTNIMTAYLPSDEDIEDDIEMFITDASAAEQFNDAYSLFLDHLASLE
ncbi:hypothetical protein FisN_2Lh425 [Fistulifera solaris]|uniref:Uncharacterized protein n=1 Tax=Fistulifera solaris TaxID=1519565 RepID=A0A1Z5JPA0_FISSO|nr:hypothetical protein FisN_2Lh425 [Fistulifera solaris]|eukprot:GAX15850.1 hypothetical protein FisN_2Lh425 [Fistulifera solaris]